jgi:hypothetical protein
MDGDVIIAELELEGLTIGLNSIAGLSLYNGKNLRVTYAYGTVGQQVTDYVDFKAAEIEANLDGYAGTVAQFEAEL